MDDISWLSMVLATLMPILIGFLYYHKNVFGNVWLDTISTRENQTKKPNNIVTLIVAILLSFFLSFFLLNFNNSGINQEGDFDTFAHGAWHGTFIAVTTVAPVIVVQGFFGRRKWKHMLINILYWMITLALMGGILDSMNHWQNIPMPDGF
ncbi:DUF1761 domain-containing protein [Psychroserpens luteolus]|uniref:DUF1761 domain-containing protein n=1 Tax=Psychroserpens luteolus TaxID=2855840 RepID=UPI001E2BAC1D|nr:DUF1761 domain-containing protein [Psychroserpens luteolus]MCD2259768.1 DUF1761 domain-containing protein [Psychroserpens luteolus]